MVVLEHDGPLGNRDSDVEIAVMVDVDHIQPRPAGRHGHAVNSNRASENAELAVLVDRNSVAIDCDKVVPVVLEQLSDHR